MDWALTGASIGLIIAFCYLLDWLVSKKEEDKQKVKIIKWWSQLDDFNYRESVRKSNIFCNDIFNKIYGKKHLSLRCFLVSCCVSIFSVLMLMGICIFCGVIDISVDLTVIVLLMLVINTCIDYVSLIETRLILRYASRVKQLFLPVLLLLDVFLTAAIYLLSLVILSYVLRLILIFKGPNFISFPDDFVLTLLRETVPDLLTFDFNRDPFGCIAFYSTFSTSIIFYLYCLSTVFFKLVKLSKTRVMAILEKLEDSDRLFKALGGFLAAVVGLVKCVVEICQYTVQV